jgi:ribonuclease G
MAKNILVISCDYRETRAALIENGIIAELHIERKGRDAGSVGNVYLGKVTRVLPGLQAAFIDIGQERAAFLHVEDLIRPDDFDEYLAGGRKLARGEEAPAAEEVVDEPAAAAPSAPDAELLGVSQEPSSDEVLPVLDQPASREDLREGADAIEEEEEESVGAEAEGVEDEEDEDEGEGEGEDEPSSRAGLEPNDLEATVAYADWPDPLAPSRPRNGTTSAREALDPDASAMPVSEPPSTQDAAVADPSSSLLVMPAFDDESARDLHEAVVLSDAPTLDELPQTKSEPPEADDDLIDDDLPGFTISEPGEPVPRAPAPRSVADRERGERGGRRRGRGRGRGRDVRDTRDARPPADRRAEDPRARGRQGSRGRVEGRPSRGRDGQRSTGLPGRLSKSTPIREVVKEGQEIIVQVTKDPIGTKGARCSSHISLPGRYVVYLPTVDHIGISKRIGNDKERARLRDAIEAMKPPSGGLIVRTVAEGLTKKGLKQDIGYLVRLWGEVAKKREGARAPTMLSSELDLVLKVARDLFTDEVDEIVVDDRQQYERLCRFVEMFAPDRIKDVKLYDEEEPIFDEYGIEDEIGRALSRKVPLPSGGHLIIDQAEALTAIDVNTGRFVGKGSKDMEETILKTNLEAVHEIAYQLRFRNIGGLIILDLIDMEQHKNREKVRRTLEELLQKDKAKTTLNRISDLGLIEMTRKRTRESLGRLLHEPCFYCDGTGQLQSKETIAYEILREIRRKRSTLPGYSVVVNAHPAVADVLNSTEKAAVQDAENRFMRKILVTPRKEYHLEQFDLQGK